MDFLHIGLIPVTLELSGEETADSAHLKRGASEYWHTMFCVYVKKRCLFTHFQKICSSLLRVAPLAALDPHCIVLQIIRHLLPAFNDIAQYQVVLVADCTCTLSGYSPGYRVWKRQQFSMLMYFPMCHLCLPVFAFYTDCSFSGVIFIPFRCETHVQRLVKVLSKLKNGFFALISTTFVFLSSFLTTVEPSQRGSSYGSLITAHGKYQLFAKTGYFKVRLSEF